MSTENESETYLTLDEAQAILGVAKRTSMETWIAVGRFVGARERDGEWQIPAVEVEAFRAAGERAEALARLPRPLPVGEYEGDPLDLI